MKECSFRFSGHLCRVNILCSSPAALAACSTARARSQRGGVCPAVQHAGRGTGTQATWAAHAGGCTCRAAADAAAAAGDPHPYDEAASGGRLKGPCKLYSVPN